MLWLGAIVHLATTSWQQLKICDRVGERRQSAGTCRTRSVLDFFFLFFFVSQLKGLSFSAKVPLISSERNRPYV